MIAIGIDPGSVTGIAIGEFGKRPISETIKLPTMYFGARCNALRGRLRQLIRMHKVERVIVESVYINPSRFSGPQVQLAYGWRAAIHMAMDEEGLQNHVQEITVAAWRSAMNIPTQAPKGLPPPDRRKWLKRACLNRCVELGFTPNGEDEADALGLWLWGETMWSQAESNQRLPLFA